MKQVIKVLILLTRNMSIFTVKYLRNFRWFLYRKYYDANKLYIDDNVVISIAHFNPDGSYFKANGEVNIGKDTYIDYSGGIILGDKIAISEGVKIFTHNHSIHDGDINWKINKIIFSSLNIENFVWIGAGAIILPSVNKIGEGAIIAAGAILTKNADPLGIYAGNPAIKIGTRKLNGEKS